MAVDPVEEFFRRQNQPSDSTRHAITRWRNHLITAGAAVAELSDGAGVLSAALSLARDIGGGRAVEALSDRVRSIEARIAELEAHPPRGRLLRGSALAVFAATLQVEVEKWYGHLDSEEAIALLGLTPDDYRDAALELTHLRLVFADPSASSRTGIVRTRLTDSAYLRGAGRVMPELDVEGETARILVRLGQGQSTHWYVQASTLLEDTGVPLPRFDLIMRGLVAYRLVKGEGTANPSWGSDDMYEVTPAGRRVIRGDDALEASL